MCVWGVHFYVHVCEGMCVHLCVNVCAYVSVHVFVCVGSGVVFGETSCVYLASEISVPMHTPFPGKGCTDTKQCGPENEEPYQHIFPWRGKKRLEGPLLPISGEPRN